MSKARNRKKVLRAKVIQVPKRIFYKVFNQNKEIKKIILKENRNNLSEDEWIRVVSCFIVNKNGEVLMETRGDNGIDAGMLDLCSGHIDCFETPTQTMLRELYEELCIKREEAFRKLMKITTKQLIFDDAQKKRNYFDTFFYLPVEEEDFKIQEDEISCIKWVPMEEVFELIENGQTRFPKR